jgi:hypothetical protein
VRGENRKEVLPDKEMEAVVSGNYRCLRKMEIRKFSGTDCKPRIDWKNSSFRRAWNVTGRGLSPERRNNHGKQ